MNYLIIRIYSKEGISLEDASRDYLLSLLDNKDYSFELYNTEGNIVAAFRNHEKDNDLYVSDAVIVFEEPVIINDDIVSLLNTKDFEVIVPTEEKTDYLWYFTNGYFSVIENNDKNSFTFYREDGGNLTGSEDEQQLMFYLLFEVLKLKYETEFSGNSFLFEPTFQTIGDALILINVCAKSMKEVRVRQKNKKS